ncbi:MAG: hypothetical protein WBL20_16625 [Sphingobium sp.]|uniref:hypothetical protein n=1 Tax=Sphingobium sp. TaxID=1912891 RepID=UPI002E1EC698
MNMTVLSGLKAMLGLQGGGTSPVEGESVAGQGFSALLAIAQGAIAPKAASGTAMVEADAPAHPDVQAVPFASPSMAAASPALSGAGETAQLAQPAVTLNQPPAPRSGAHPAALDGDQPTAKVEGQKDIPPPVGKPAAAAKSEALPADPVADALPPAERSAAGEAVGSDRSAKRREDGTPAAAPLPTQAAPPAPAPAPASPTPGASSSRAVAARPALAEPAASPGAEAGTLPSGAAKDKTEAAGRSQPQARKAASPAKFLTIVSDTGAQPVSAEAAAVDKGAEAPGSKEKDEAQALVAVPLVAPVVTEAFAAPTAPAAAVPLPIASPEASTAVNAAVAQSVIQREPPSKETIATAPVQAKPQPAAEAVALLQLVRDHVQGGGKDAAERGAPTSGQGGENLSAAATPAVHQSAAAPPATAAPLPSTAQPIPAPMPVVDLSASIGAQVVDMGVSGQWIDGLARDIAGLSAHGAQGRFQIDAAQLGPIQVDIRQSAEGAAVSLTVATDLAEQALRQDSDRLKLDASLSAVRISEVRVERTPAPETTRNDGSGAQSAAQGQGQSSAHSPSQNQAQTQAQSNPHGQGRARENIRHPHKGGGDAAVLNHEQGGATATDLPRARYA